MEKIKELLNSPKKTTILGLIGGIILRNYFINRNHFFFKCDLFINLFTGIIADYRDNSIFYSSFNANVFKKWIY